MKGLIDSTQRLGRALLVRDPDDEDDDRGREQVVAGAVAAVEGVIALGAFIVLEEHGVVRTPVGFKDAYRKFVDGGWKKHAAPTASLQTAAAPTLAHSCVKV